MPTYNYDKFWKSFVSKLHFDILSFGSTDESIAIQASNAMHDLLRSNEIDVSSQKSPQEFSKHIASGECHSIHFQNSFDALNNAVGIFIPISEVNDANAEAIAKIYTRVIKSKFFDDLRTKKQFGYIVSQQRSEFFDFHSLQFLIQSEKSIEEVKSEILQFVDKSIDEFTSMSDEKFSEFVNTEIEIAKTEDNSLHSDFSRINSQFLRNCFALNSENFNEHAVTIAALQNLKREVLIESIRKNAIDESTKRFLCVECSKK